MGDNIKNHNKRRAYDVFTDPTQNPKKLLESISVDPLPSQEQPFIFSTEPLSQNELEFRHISKYHMKPPAPNVPCVPTPSTIPPSNHLPSLPLVSPSRCFLASHSAPLFSPFPNMPTNLSPPPSSPSSPPPLPVMYLSDAVPTPLPPVVSHHNNPPGTLDFSDCPANSNKRFRGDSNVEVDEHKADDHTRQHFLRPMHPRRDFTSRTHNINYNAHMNRHRSNTHRGNANRQARGNNSYVGARFFETQPNNRLREMIENPWSHLEKNLPHNRPS